MSETDIKRWCHILLNETAQGKNNTKCPPVAVSILHECYLHTCQYLPVIYIKKKKNQNNPPSQSSQVSLISISFLT